MILYLSIFFTLWQKKKKKQLMWFLGRLEMGGPGGSAIRIALCRAGKRRNFFSFSFQARLWIRGQELAVQMEYFGD